MHSAIESYYGIGMGGDNKLTNVKKFTGDNNAWPEWRSQIISELSRKGIILPKSKDDSKWMKINQVVYAKKAAEAVILDAAAIAADPLRLSQEFEPGDCALSVEGRILYLTARDQAEVKKQTAISIVHDSIVRGSLADNVSVMNNMTSRRSGLG